MDSITAKQHHEAMETVNFLRRLLEQNGIGTEDLKWETCQDPEIFAAFKIPTATGGVYLYAFPALD
jgi:hypothetical protein